MAKSMIRFNCNFCPYNLMVTEALEEWASQVMLVHARQKHPGELEKKDDPTPEERLSSSVGENGEAPLEDSKIEEGGSEEIAASRVL